jgi:mono/diheme cytochrome c family protein
MCRCSRKAVALFGVVMIAVVAAGCVQEMANQPRYETFQPSAAFDDGMSARPPVPGTVPRGQLQLDEPFFTGKEDGRPVGALPEQALAGRSMEQLLARGRDRYSIFCSQCHGRVGGGVGGAKEYESLVGMVVLRGFPSPPTYHQSRLRQAPIGYFFDVITNGVGRMPAHGYLVPPADRWAIAAYIRALQLSQNAPASDLPPAELQNLNAQTTNTHWKTEGTLISTNLH